jgi:hypothetical protein
MELVSKLKEEESFFFNSLEWDWIASLLALRDDATIARRVRLQLFSCLLCCPVTSFGSLAAVGRSVLVRYGYYR